MDYILKSSDERVVINDFVQGDPLSEENLDRTLELVSNLIKVDFANPCKIGVSEDENTDEIRLSLPNKSIWLYSGYTFDYIMEGIGYDENGAFFFLDNDKKRYEIISKCDVLVDGRYIDSQRNPSKKFAGSDNQRIIEIRKSLEQNKIVLHCD